MTTLGMQPQTAAYLKDLARRLRDYRKRTGLKQSALAAAVGVSPSTISGIENSPLAVTPTTIGRLAAAIPEFSTAYVEYVATLHPQSGPAPSLTQHQRQLIGRIKELLDELLANG